MGVGQPHYNLRDFLADCSQGTAKVFVSAGALKDAQTNLGLKTMEDAIAFLTNGGFKNPQFVNSKDWENNPNPTTPVKVDAYHFSADTYNGSHYCYLAFFKASATSKWIIKSYKKESSGDPRNLALSALGALLKGGKNV